MKESDMLRKRRDRIQFIISKTEEELKMLREYEKELDAQVKEAVYDESNRTI